MKQQASQFVTALEMADGTDIPYVAGFSRMCYVLIKYTGQSL